MGVVALPAMLARGYKKELALGCICAGGGLATLIPPSVVFIMYGLTAGVSIGQLYVAGIVPGLMLAAHVHRLHRDPLLAAPRLRAAGERGGARDLRCARSSRCCASSSCRGSSRSACSARSTSAGRRRPRRPASACVGAIVAMVVERPASLGASCARRRGHDQGHGDALLAVLRLVGADRRLHAGRRHQADPGHDDRAAGRPDRRRHHDPDHLDHPRLLHRLDRHPAADRADLRAGRATSSASTRSGWACCSA